MKIDRAQFLQAARSFGGWIDRDSGCIVRRGWMGNQDGLFTVREGEIVPVDRVQGEQFLEIPRLCPGYVELAFLRRHRGELASLIESYQLEEYMEETLPVFLGPNDEEATLETGRRIWSRTLMLCEENASARTLFEEDAIEDAVLQKWCAENGVDDHRKST